MTSVEDHKLALSSDSFAGLEIKDILAAITPRFIAIVDLTPAGALDVQATADYGAMLADGHPRFVITDRPGPIKRARRDQASHDPFNHGKSVKEEHCPPGVTAVSSSSKCGGWRRLVLTPAALPYKFHFVCRKNWSPPKKARNVIPAGALPVVTATVHVERALMPPVSASVAPGQDLQQEALLEDLVDGQARQDTLNQVLEWATPALTDATESPFLTETPFESPAAPEALPLDLDPLMDTPNFEFFAMLAGAAAYQAGSEEIRPAAATLEAEPFAQFTPEGVEYAPLEQLLTESFEAFDTAPPSPMLWAEMEADPSEADEDGLDRLPTGKRPGSPLESPAKRARRF